MTMTPWESTPTSILAGRQPLVPCAAVAAVVVVGLVLIDHRWSVKSILHVRGALISTHISLFRLV
jgi:hypothetical protein